MIKILILFAPLQNLEIAVKLLDVSIKINQALASMVV